MKSTAALGFLLLGVGVALGAFGAHGLRDYFIGREEEIWKTAVFYQLVHAFGLLVIVAFEKLQLLQNKHAAIVSRTMLVGMLIFSGTLYILVLSREKWLGAITPIGGSLLIFSWLYLAYLSFVSRAKAN